MTPAAPDGLLVVDKPAGWTSHDVVARGRRITGTRKVGHAGTLDPMATGVLLLGVGRATRLLGHLALSTKGYDATIRLGQRTITDDAEGEVVETAAADEVTDEDIAAAIARLTGAIDQVPSAVSAIKIDGQRSYARVRAGEQVDIPPRRVTVSEFSLSSRRRGGAGLVDLDVHVECSTGTYVRALARDLGVLLGVGGHLTALRRTRVGSFTLDLARPLETLEQGPIEDFVVPLAAVALAHFPTYVVPDGLVSSVRNGRPLNVDLGVAGEPVAMMTLTGEFVALYHQAPTDPQRPTAPAAKPIAVFAPA